MPDRREYRAALAGLPRRRDQVLPALHVGHAIAGWLPEPAIEAVADLTSVPLSELYGIISSYSELRRAPPPRPYVEICTGLSCRLNGADALQQAAIDAGSTVETVPCRFLCGVAPVIERNGEYVGRANLSLQPPTPAREGETRSSMVDRDSPSAKAAGRGERYAIADSLCARSVGAEAVAAAICRARPDAEVTRVGCDGACWAQPVVLVSRGDEPPHRHERVTPERAAHLVDGTPDAGRRTPQVAEILARCGVVDPESFDDARRLGAYRAWERARAMPPDALVALVKEAGLRGRGGAYFPLALKWESALRHDGPRYLVVNAEEGEPGAFKDRHLMEGDPHLLVEGIAIAAHAAGTERVFIYINGQAQLSAERIGRALAEARDGGVLDPAVGIEIYRGAGGYVCGEESVILNSIEGERAVPRPRPPLPIDAGLWGRPTVISNVETLCNLPRIVAQGAGAFRSTGTDAFPGTKLISISGAVRRPGLYEAPIGVTARHLVQLAGGVPEDRTLRALVMGGPSGGFLPPELLDVPLEGGLIHPSGPVLGSGGIVVLDDSTPLAFVLRELTAYNAVESCGKCTPCREGTGRALDLLDAAAESGLLSDANRAELLELCDLMQFASLCGLGQMAPGPIRSALALFGAELPR